MIRMRTAPSGAQQDMSGYNQPSHHGSFRSSADVEGGAIGAVQAFLQQSSHRWSDQKIARRIASVQWEPISIGVAVVGFLLFVSTSGIVSYMSLIFTLCFLALIYALRLAGNVLRLDEGTAEMQSVSNAIREGAEGYMAVQYGYIFKLAGLVAALVWISYALRDTENAGVSSFTMATVTSVGFLLGALCSAFAGYVGLWVSVRSNIRVASAATRSYTEGLQVCIEGGAFSAVMVVSVCILGISLLYSFCYAVFHVAGLRDHQIPLLVVGYGFGASFTALFMQLGGGIYTKAADVGADMVGKVEVGIPEDDPRNPAVIADLVGDNVGDCAGSSADIFESIAAEIIGAMILGGTMASEGQLENPQSYIFFPLVIHAFDLAVSSIGIMALKRMNTSALSGDPMALMKRGYMVAMTLGFTEFCMCTRWLLHTEKAPSAWMHFALCGAMGMLCSYVFIANTQYYTDYNYDPVKRIARASMTGHGTNIIQGVAVGMESTAVPVLMVVVSVFTCYTLGKTAGLPGDPHNAGLFGTAVGTMGMLSAAVFVLSMNNYGPIADNAGGIVEMANLPESVRDITDKLDAVGNVTKAITKGYSIGSASLACFLLFGAFMDEFSEFAHTKFRTVDIAVPEILLAGLVGVMIIFLFSGMAISAVGNAAEQVVAEVRRQFREHPAIMDGVERPDYGTCIRIVTRAALREMVRPGLLVVIVPIAIGLTGRVIGSFSDRPLLGAEMLAGYLMFSTVTGILMALFMDNVGGAWDNAKKLVETGLHGGKGSEAHKAAVTGDTVGDPFKDTAGPSLHVVIKLLSTTVLVMGPLFLNRTV